MRFFKFFARNKLVLLIKLYWRKQKRLEGS